MEDLKRSVQFATEHGVVFKTTPTVAELIEYLQQFPPETEVWAEWEGQTKGIGPCEYKDGQLTMNVEYDVVPPRPPCQETYFKNR